jgi:hypothetical protein
MIAKKISGKNESLAYVTSDSRPQLVVRTRGPRARRRQYSYVEAVTQLDHGLTATELEKAYKVAGSRFGSNLKKTFIVLDEALSVGVGPVSEVAAELAGLGVPGTARSSASASPRPGYFTQVSQASV